MTRMVPSEFAHGSPLEALPDAPTRQQMESLGRFLQSVEPEHGPVDLGTVHHFADRLYGRSVLIKAGTLLVGLPHKQGALNVCAGDITVWTEEGRARFTGVHLVNGTPGAMRVGFAHADTTWLSIHRNDTGGTALRRHSADQGIVTPFTHSCAISFHCPVCAPCASCRCTMSLEIRPASGFFSALLALPQ